MSLISSGVTLWPAVCFCSGIGPGGPASNQGRPERKTTTMRTRIIQAATAALLLGQLPAAHAVPTLSFSVDGGAAIACADGAVCDTNPNAGVVTFSQSLG